MYLVVKNIVEDNPSDTEDSDKEVPAVTPRLPVAVGGEGDDLHEDLDDEANGQGRADVDQGFSNNTVSLFTVLEESTKEEIIYWTHWNLDDWSIFLQRWPVFYSLFTSTSFRKLWEISIKAYLGSKYTKMNNLVAD